MGGKPINNGHVSNVGYILVRLPLQDLLWELRQRRVQLIRVQVKEEIEPKEAAVKGRVS